MLSRSSRGYKSTDRTSLREVQNAKSLMNRFLEKRFFRRPRVLNFLHWANLVGATSQTIPVELKALERHAAGAHQALEIGTYQGVSAARIAGALAPDGLLYCVDPWPKIDGQRRQSLLFNLPTAFATLWSAEPRSSLMWLQRRDVESNARPTGFCFCRW